MYNYLYAEILKLKRSKTIISLYLSGILFPLFWFVLSNFIDNKQTWEVYVSESGSTFFMVIETIVFALLASHMFLREYSNNTAGLLHCYPVKRVSIYAIKLAVIYIIVTAVYITYFILIFLGGFFIVKEPLSKEFLLLHLKMYAISLLFQYSIIPFMAFVANLIKNQTISALFAIFIMFTNSAAFMLGKQNVWPLMLPYISVINPYKPLDIGFMAIMAFGIFVVGTVLGILQFSKIEGR
jgi:bacitracin transport system permease protein